jgi:hypothetical protein
MLGFVLSSLCTSIGNAQPRPKPAFDHAAPKKPPDHITPEFNRVAKNPHKDTHDRPAPALKPKPGFTPK